MTAKPCKHPKLDKTLHCKTCGVKVDIREKRNKYGNRKTVVDGITFDSAKEARRWFELSVARNSGIISYLARQTAFALVVNGVHICDYKSDFDYHKDGKRIVEDVKSKATKTPAYRLKKKLLKAIFGLEVIEV